MKIELEFTDKCLEDMRWDIITRTFELASAMVMHEAGSHNDEHNVKGPVVFAGYASARVIED